MERLCGGPSHQGALAVLELPAWTPDDCLRGDGWLVALDSVQDPANLGGIARAALAFGASGLWCRQGGARQQNPRAYRAAAGAFLHLPIAHLPDFEAQIEALGWPIWVASAHGEALGDEWPAPGRAVLVLGNEGRGSTLALGRNVAIPMRGASESLNVSQAAAVLLWRAQSALQAGGHPV